MGEASYDTAAASTNVTSGLPLPLLFATRYMELLGEVCKGLPSLANVVNPTESQVIQALFSTAAEASIVTLQNRIEAMCYNLGRQATKRDATAGGWVRGDGGVLQRLTALSTVQGSGTADPSPLGIMHCSSYACQ